jgi:hypothetical protein
MIPRHVLAAAVGLAMLGSAFAQDNPISSAPQLPATGAYPVRQDSSQWLGSNLIGAKVVSHGRYIVFQMAEVAIARQMFQKILRLIAELRLLPPSAPA